MSEVELIPATFTGFDEAGAVDLGAVERQAAALAGSGVRRVFVNGTTGEFASLRVDERVGLADRWCEVAGDELGVIVHVGHTSLADARHMAARAEASGANGIAAITPFFFQPADADNLVDFAAQIAAAAPATPFFHYYIPSMTRSRLRAVEVLERSIDRIPTLAGLKFTHEDLIEYAGCLAVAGDEREVLFGRDELLLSALAEGARGAVGSCYALALPLFRRLGAAFSRGDLPASRAAQAQARLLIDTAVALDPLPAFKHGMELLGVPCGPCRAPLKPLDERARRTLRAALEATTLL
jgi:N-acetylneuraminate lyase